MQDRSLPSLQRTNSSGGAGSDEQPPGAPLRRASSNGNNGGGNNQRRKNKQHQRRDHDEGEEEAAAPGFFQRVKDGMYTLSKRMIYAGVALLVIFLFFAFRTPTISNEVCPAMTGSWHPKPEKAPVFPLRYKIKEKRYLMWTPFQSFEMIDANNTWLGEFYESVWSWIYELFGSAYISLYDYKGAYNSNLKFDFIFLGSKRAYTFDYNKQWLMTGKLEPFWYSMFHGRRRPFVIRDCDGRDFSSLKTNLIQFSQRWEIADEDGRVAAKMEEYVVTDFWGSKFRGWDVQVFTDSHGKPLIDPRLPGFLCAVDLGAGVLHEPSLQTAEMKASTPPLPNQHSGKHPSTSSASASGPAPASASSSSSSSAAAASDITAKQVTELLKRMSDLEEKSTAINQKNLDMHEEINRLKFALNL